MVIEIPGTIVMEEIDAVELRKDWHTIEHYTYCQSLGSKWLYDGRSAILKVPSVVIHKEHNYLINPQHPDFDKIQLTGIEDFDFDKRF
jgi:RES domain-containing protein